MSEPPYTPVTPAESAVYELYSRLLTYWNERDAQGMASLFTKHGNAIGFDGSMMDGQKAMTDELSKIFGHHPTATYVWKVREIRNVSDHVVLLRSVVGMVPPGKHDINPATNAIQSLIARLKDGKWEIELFQNTPAQFHGRPEMVKALTEELQEMVFTPS